MDFGARYSVIRTLGVGSGGTVVLATDSHGDGRAFALKRSVGAAAVARLLAEFRVMGRVAHPGFARALGYERRTVDNSALLRMEAALGAPLDVSVPEGRADQVRFAADLLRALAHLHQLGLVHGDISPRNVLRAEGGPSSVKVLDLGAAGAPGTGGGLVSGTLQYLSPRRLSGGARESQDDLWSAGVVIASLLLGAHPWPEYPARVPANWTVERLGTLGSVGAWTQRLLMAPEHGGFADAGAALRDLEVSDRAAGSSPDWRSACLRSAPPWVGSGRDPGGWEGTLEDWAALPAPVYMELGGATGSGRSRVLAEAALRLGARGISVVASGASLGPGDLGVLGRAARELGLACADDSEISTVSWLNAVRALGRPVALLIDDLDGAPPWIQDEIQSLQAWLITRPRRCPPVLLMVAGGTATHGPKAWGPDELRSTLHSIAPGRRVGRDCLSHLSRALGDRPGPILEGLARLIEGGALVVDDVQVALHSDAIGELLAPEADRAMWSKRLHTWPHDARVSLAGFVTEGPAVPLAVFSPECDGLRLMLESGAVALEPHVLGARVRLRVRLAAELAAELVSELEVFRYWTVAWTRVGSDGAARALALQVRAKVPGILARAEAMLSELAPGARSVLGHALVESGGELSNEARLTIARSAAATHEPEFAASVLASLFDMEGGGPLSGVVSTKAALSLGRMWCRSGRHQEAVTLLLRIDLAGVEARVRGGCFAALARAHVLMGRLDESEKWGADGRALDTALDDEARASLYYTAALVCWYRGEVSEASAFLATAFGAARALSSPAEEAAVLTVQGMVAHRRGAHEDAVRLYERALARGEDAGDLSRVLSVLQNLGVVHQERGAWGDALAFYREARRVAAHEGQVARLVQLDGNLGNLLIYLGATEEAQGVLETGLVRAKALEHDFMQAAITNLLSAVAVAQGRWSDAERLGREAVSGMCALGCEAEAVEARLDLARVYLERQDLDLAREAAETALTLAGTIERPKLVAMAHALLAEAALLAVEGDWELAQRHIDTALEEIGTLTNPDERWPVLRTASRVYWALGDGTTARMHAQGVRDTLCVLGDAVPTELRPGFGAVQFRARALRETHFLVDEPSPHAAVEGVSGAEDGRWARLLAINKRLSTESKIAPLLEYIMDSAVWLSGAERGFLLIAGDEDAGGFRVRVARNLDGENIRKTKMKISHSIATRVLREGEATLTVDAMEDDRYRAQLSVHNLRLRSILCVPMTARGRVVGVIYLDNRFQSAAFSDDDLRLLEAFADQAALAMDTARLLQAEAESREALERSRAEIVGLNRKLTEQLASRTQELEDTHRVVIRQQRQLVAKHSYDQMIGSSDAMRRVFGVMDRVLDNAVTVLIEGESGTGKELVARAIHFNGERRARPFVAVNCGAIPANLLESEFFGHVRGAFTGASHDKIGLFEAADKGTLFLDELGELPLEMQVKLLRVLQEGEVKKVGATRSVRVNTRIIAATNRELSKEVAAGRFREDLYYRLSTIPIRLPPLRERSGDIPLLVRHFIGENQREGLGEVTGVSPEAMVVLERFEWPGNVRQLETVLKNATLFAETKTITPDDFRAFPELSGSITHGGGAQKLAGRTLAEIERLAIIQTLSENRGNKKRSAEQLGIDRRTLYNKLAAYKIVIEKALKIT